MVGTPQYLAPEVVLHEKGEGYGQAVDSWSVGIIVYAMLTKVRILLSHGHGQAADRPTSSLLAQLLPFSEDKDDTIEVKLTKRAKERVDYTPFDDFGVSGIGASAPSLAARLLAPDGKTLLSCSEGLCRPPADD